MRLQIFQRRRFAASRSDCVQGQALQRGHGTCACSCKAAEQPTGHRNQQQRGRNRAQLNNTAQRLCAELSTGCGGSSHYAAAS